MSKSGFLDARVKRNTWKIIHAGKRTYITPPFKKFKIEKIYINLAQFVVNKRENFKPKHTYFKLIIGMAKNHVNLQYFSPAFARQ